MFGKKKAVSWDDVARFAEAHGFQVSHDGCGSTWVGVPSGKPKGFERTVAIYRTDHADKQDAIDWITYRLELTK